MRSIKSCGVLLMSHDRRRFLLMRHRTRWDLPKGHAEPGETDLACALRELREETGVSPDRVQVFDGFRHCETYRTQYRRFGNELVEKTVVFFLAQLADSSVEIRPTEHAAYQWHAWAPPHSIQEQTVDPLLTAVEGFLNQRDNGQ